jgi:xanthine permease XanP
MQHDSGRPVAKTRKPPNILFGVDERPPATVTAVSGLQHVALMATYLVYPVLIAQAAGSSAEVTAAVVGMTLLAMAIGALLQALPVGIGSGFLCQPTPSAVYFIPSLMAAKHGGLPAVFGMTIAAGLLELALARILGRLRALLPAEIAGLVVLLAGVTTGVVGLRTAFGAADASATPPPMDVGLALVTLGIMVALNVWGRGPLRLFCVLIGMAAGYATAWALGGLSTPHAAAASVPWLAFPGIAHLGWSFDTTLIFPFVVAALAASLKVIGNVTTCQKVNDADWVRPDMRTIARGVSGDGLSSVVAGALGAHGINTSTGAVGLATATGVTSRHVAYAVAAILFVLAFVPKIGQIFHFMPRPVAGAALVFSSTFIIINGLVIMTSRLLDARKTLVIGLALVFGLAVEVSPGLLAILPQATSVALGSMLVMGTLIGLGLNGLFRIGLRRTLSITVDPQRHDREAIAATIERQGALWGARRDVINRASYNLHQSIETIVDSCSPQGPLTVTASFDEFRLDLGVSYHGPALELPDKRPSTDEILESGDGERKLAGFMLRRLADEVSVSHKAGVSRILFHFDH